jgi:GAF domain-containing protein
VSLTLGVGRVTLRRDIVDERGRRFPVTDEILAYGATSIMDEEYADIFTSPVARRVAGGEQVVQHDSASCYPDDEEFQAMLGEYGGMGAQIVTPVLVAGAVVAILSVHHLGDARHWSAREVRACSEATERIARVLAVPVR